MVREHWDYYIIHILNDVHQICIKLYGNYVSSDLEYLTYFVLQREKIVKREMKEMFKILKEKPPKFKCSYFFKNT